jgi:hypothetical protein
MWSRPVWCTIPCQTICEGILGFKLSCSRLSEIAKHLEDYLDVLKEIKKKKMVSGNRRAIIYTNCPAIRERAKY